MIKTTRANVERLGLEGECTVRRGDALKLVRSKLPGAPFDVAFVDPPYESGLQDLALAALAEGRLLAPSALIVVERAAAHVLSRTYGRFELARTERYGSTEVALYESTQE